LKDATSSLTEEFFEQLPRLRPDLAFGVVEVSLAAPQASQTARRRK
jgi:hypothetical protein